MKRVVGRNLEQLREDMLLALKEEISYHRIQLGQPKRSAAVLALFGRSEKGVSLLLTQRTDKVETHKGQMAFPGGLCDPEDGEPGAGQTNIVTSLRETYEEVGIPSREIETLGQLPSFVIPTSKFLVTPVLGILKSSVESVRLQLSEDEIQEAIWIPLERFFEPDVYSVEEITHENMKFPVHTYQVDQYRIWGATAAMIFNLFERLQRIYDNQ